MHMPEKKQNASSNASSNRPPSQPQDESQLTFDIRALYPTEEGTMNEFHLRVEESFDEHDFTLDSEIETDVVFMKMKEGIGVSLEAFTCTLHTRCIRCLKEISIPVRIPHTDRTFFFHPPKDMEDVYDIYTVDVKHMKINLHELFRQEILLHFKAFPVCSASCKGICSICGADRNKADCGHPDLKEAGEEKVQPFAHLKKS